MERSERLRGNRQTGVDEESLDSGHTPGIDERGKSRTTALEIRLEAEVSRGGTEDPAGLVSCGGKVRKKAPHGG